MLEGTGENLLLLNLTVDVLGIGLQESLELARGQFYFSKTRVLDGGRSMIASNAAKQLFILLQFPPIDQLLSLPAVVLPQLSQSVLDRSISTLRSVSTNFPYKARKGYCSLRNPLNSGMRALNSRVPNRSRLYLRK